VYSEYLKQRIPERLILPWPTGIATAKFNKQTNGELDFDCDGQFQLPVWDERGEIKQGCESQPKQWLKKLFQW